MSDTIEQLLESILEVQVDILNILRDQGITIKRTYSKNRYADPITQEERDDLDEEIDLDWWYTTYGDAQLPAKYMDRQKVGFSKRELDYMHKRLSEIASIKPEVNGGTHTFQNVGKKYCKAEKNTLNCFACVPVGNGT